MNWAEIRQQVFILLDQPSNTTGDLKIAVDFAMKQVLDELVVESRPDSLLVTEGPINWTATDVNIPIGAGGFEVDDLEKIYSVSVDEDATDDEDEAEEWDYCSWKAWISANNAHDGNTRSERSWTVDPSNAIRLGSNPSDGDTWHAYLHYFRETAAIDNSGVPELPPSQHQAIVLGTVLRFPNYFQGDRQSLLVTVSRAYADARTQRLRDRSTAKKSLKMYPSRTRSRMSGTIRWE